MMKVLRNILNHKPSSMDINSTSDKKQTYTSWTPTETEDMFLDSMSLVDECQLTHLHVFPYSPRDKTPASRMPQVHKNTIKERAKRLRDKGFEKLEENLKNKIGKKELILIENNKDNISFGKDQHFIKVKIKKNIKEGIIISCIFTGIEGDTLLANIT